MPKTPSSDRAASFNPQHRAFNPTSQNTSCTRSQASNDARSNACNPQSNAYNPTRSDKK